MNDMFKLNVKTLRNSRVTCSFYGHLLNPILLKLLPHELAKEDHRARNTESGVKDLIALVKCEIECTEKTLSVTTNKVRFVF